MGGSPTDQKVDVSIPGSFSPHVTLGKSLDCELPHDGCV